MAETPPDIGQARQDVVASPPRQNGRVRMPARKLLEDRATTRHLQEMIHAMDTSQATSKLSGEIWALKDLIVALSLKVAQLTSELTATRIELMATKNEMATQNELEALKAELTAVIVLL